MRSKVHPQYKTKDRVGNWSAYEQALVQRGDVTLWLSADGTDAWRPSPSGRPGAPKTFSDCAIETALTLRLVFRLPLRQAEGFLRSVLSLMGVDLAAPTTPRSPDAVSLSRLHAAASHREDPSISSSTARDCRLWAKANGLRCNTVDAATEAGRRCILLLIEWA